MRRFRSLLVAPLVFTLAASAPASAADTVVAHLLRPSAIRSYSDIQVFSAFDGGVYRLAIRRAGQVELLPVAPSQAPFDVDIGPDVRGRPQLIYTRCKVERPDVEFGKNFSRGCDLFLYSLAGGGSERPLHNANTSANEFAPTLWKGRIVFARALKGRARPVVYATELAAPRSRPAERLPGVPRRARGEPTTGGDVAELELYGDQLAQIVSFRAEGQLSEVRLVDTSDRATRRLARVGVGEGGQYFAGLGFAGGHLAWAFDRGIGGGSPFLPGIYRYRLATGELARAASPRIVDYQVAGLALFAPDGAYMIDTQLESGGCGEADNDPAVARECQLIRSQPLSFRPIRR
jgi:hypothetical protein